jgi:hypothetical protein
VQYKNHSAHGLAPAPLGSPCDRWVRKALITAFYFIQSAMTGFTASAFLSRNCVSPKKAFEGIELCERKLSSTVLRGLDGSNPVRLLGHTTEIDLAIRSSLYSNVSEGRCG